MLFNMHTGIYRLTEPKVLLFCVQNFSSHQSLSPIQEDLVAIADPRMLKVARIVLLSWMRTLKLKSLDPEKMETAIVPVMVEVRLSKCLVPLVMN